MRSEDVSVRLAESMAVLAMHDCTENLRYRVRHSSRSHFYLLTPILRASEQVTMRYLLAVLCLVGVLAAIWLGAGAAEPDVDFTFINRGIIGRLDPAAMSWMQDIRMALTIWEGLCGFAVEIIWRSSL